MTNDYAVRAGGWDTRYAVVRARVVRDGIAAALIDPNGDGGSIDLDQYVRGSDGRWVAGNSGGSAGDSGTSWSPEMVATYGRAAPGSAVLVNYLGDTFTVTASSEGWWLFATQSLDEDTLPERCSVDQHSGTRSWREPAFGASCDDSARRRASV